MARGFLGIDNGTQGISVIFVDEEHLQVLATGEASYGMVPGLSEGCYEQNVGDWQDALQSAMQQLRQQLVVLSNTANSTTTDSSQIIQVLAIGISGQMHGEVLADAEGQVLCPVRLWCDARNEMEGRRLTDALGVKFPKRSTAARFLWTVANRPDIARATRHVTTPAGWISHLLTGAWTLGIGDAAGMFPIDPATLDFDQELLEKYDEMMVAAASAAAAVAAANESNNNNKNDNHQFQSSLRSLLPLVRRAGQEAGCLNERGARILGLPTGIPVAAAEGDQPAALAGSLIGETGVVSCCFGTSVCANIVADDRIFDGVSDAVDHFCAADGKPIHMIWLRNGTTFMNTIVTHYASAAVTVGSTLGGGEDANNNNTNNGGGDGFARVMPQLIQAAADCGGLLALPFMDDEPGLKVRQGGTALIIGWNTTNATVGNVAKAALLSTMFNLRLGCEVVDRQGYPRSQLVLSGGLTKTPECGQILADVFNTPTTLFESAHEGSCWGAALLAKFRHLSETDDTTTTGNSPSSWTAFLKSIATKGHRQFTPDPVAVATYQSLFERYKKLMEVQPQLLAAVAR